METEKKWKDLTWQEKREERFKRWLNPVDVNFKNSEAEKVYKERVNRFIKAIKMEEPDRVPVMLPTGTYPAYYAGVDFRTIIYDRNELIRAWIKFMDDFGDMDMFQGPGLVPCGQVSEVLDPRISVWPGHGLPDDATMNEVIEGEYMKADEYDAMLRDPSDYNMRVMLPRTHGLFESFRKLPPLRSIMGTTWVALMGDPEIRRTFQTLIGLADDFKQWQSTQKEIADEIETRGYPSFHHNFPMIGSAYDYFADLNRGTRGISMDMNRQPQKLLEAMERISDIYVSMIKDYPMTPCPVVLMPLHKGDDTFMSEKQFEKFYWPTLRKLFMAMINEGFVPMPFAEGKFNIRLKQIADTPKSAVVWYFDQTDMAQAKKVLGDICCIMGNVPTSIVIKGTRKQVKENCRKLIETCAPGGGYILSGGASIDNGKFENLKAMMEAAYDYGTYK